MPGGSKKSTKVTKTTKVNKTTKPLRKEAPFEDTGLVTPKYRREMENNRPPLNRGPKTGGGRPVTN